jgi:hypothetical protein
MTFFDMPKFFVRHNTGIYDELMTYRGFTVLRVTICPTIIVLFSKISLHNVKSYSM